VVHVEHGIGKFASVTTMSTDSSEKEYLILLYAGGDKLYVPTDQIDRVCRYIGASELPPALSRLGTQEWIRTKQKVSESVEKIAQELLALYATREVIPGFAFSPDTTWQHELEASFPYVETPDQIAVLEQVKEDMAKPKPMDRLVSGDVGYGKTEVAIRAAFKVVMDGKQVAVLVPLMRFIFSSVLNSGAMQSLYGVSSGYPFSIFEFLYSAPAIAIIAAIFVLTLLCIIFFYRKKIVFRTLFVTQSVIYLIALGFYYFFVMGSMYTEIMEDQPQIGNTFMYVGGAFALIPSLGIMVALTIALFKSKRVKNTFN